MGSGSKSLYGTGSSGSGSQPYAPSYHVEASMHQMDINDGVYRNGQYIKNPTANKLTNMIDRSYVGNKQTSFKMPYVVDLDGNIIIGKRNGNGRGPDALPTPHPTLIGGKDPQVQIAGILEVRGGKIFAYDNRSGHFKPNKKSLKAADDAFGKLDKSLFHKHFRKG